MVDKPERGEIVYEYMPQNLSNGRPCWAKYSYADLDYLNHRLKAGLLYYSKEAVELRAQFDRAQVAYWCGLSALK